MFYRLWLILWEYEEILHQGLLKEAISEALPHFASISTLSLPYLADDRYDVVVCLESIIFFKGKSLKPIPIL